MIDQLGITPTGVAVVVGVFRFVETYGTPLEDLLERLRSTQRIPCWVTYYREARKAGMKHDRILSRLDPAIVDSYGSELRDYVIKGLEVLYRKNLL